MKQASGKAFSGAGFAGDEDGRVKCRNRAEFSPSPPDGEALADQPLAGKLGDQAPRASSRSGEYVFGCCGDSNYVPHPGFHDLSCLQDADLG